MASFNRIIIVGNITRDLVVSTTPGGTTVCKFSIATNRKYRTKNDEQRDEVCFIDCVLFGRGAETFHKYMNKGSQVLVEGRLMLNQWTDKESGNKRSKHEIAVENFTFLGKPATESPKQVTSDSDVDDVPF